MSNRGDMAVVLEPAEALEDLPQPRPLKLAAPKELTDEDIEEFARSSGMATISAKRLRACKAIGDFVDQQGAVPIGRGILIEVQDGLRTVFAEAVRCVQHPPARDEDQSEAELKLALAKSATEVSHELVSCANSLIASEKIAREAKAVGVQPSPFGRGTPMMPIQAQNVHVTVESREPENPQGD